MTDSANQCVCSIHEVRRYTKKISGPLLDRIDLHIHVPRLEYNELTGNAVSESSALIRQRVEAARLIQRERLQRYGLFCNAQMNHKNVKSTCTLTAGAQSLLKRAFAKMNLSARSYDRIIKVGRTIADLDQSDSIMEIHIAEAIQLRNNIHNVF